jgi:hypothetical protein
LFVVIDDDRSNTTVALTFELFVTECPARKSAVSIAFHDGAYAVTYAPA